jgi:hypothetical protein
VKWQTDILNRNRRGSIRITSLEKARYEGPVDRNDGIVAGLYQIAIIMPANVGTGDQSVVVESAGIHSPSGVYINVAQ